MAQKIGTIDEIYMDAQTSKPEWLAVKTGLFGSKVSFIPIAEASDAGDDVRVPYDKAQVKDAPTPRPTASSPRTRRPLSTATTGSTTQRPARTPGCPAGQRRQQTDRDAVGHDTSGPTTDDAMTRSEEELRGGQASRESGRARLRKYVVTEEVEQTVPVQREEVRLEREPITDANVGDAKDGPAISEEEHEVMLHEEEVVTEKRAVPKERVRMDKQTVTDEQTVSEEVRKEQIEAERDTHAAAAAANTQKGKVGRARSARPTQTVERDGRRVKWRSRRNRFSGCCAAEATRPRPARPTRSFPTTSTSSAIQGRCPNSESIPASCSPRQCSPSSGSAQSQTSRSSRTASREQLNGNATRRAPNPTIEGDMMSEKHDQPARPEQPRRGGFEEGQQTLPDSERVGQFSDGNEALPDDERVGQFSDGNERLPDSEREGQFSDSVEPAER